MKKNKVLAIVGPTAIGKTDFSIEVAKTINGEILSADSRQVYKWLDICTGKVKPAETKGIPHHMIDVYHPMENISVEGYKKLAKSRLDEILERKNVPIIVGGTGYYVESLIYDIDYPELKSNKVLRSTLEKNNLAELQATFAKLIKKQKHTVDIKNKRKLMRAIELITYFGKIPKTERKNPYDFKIFCLTASKDTISKKILKRTKMQLKEGMVEEISKLVNTGKISHQKLYELGLEFRIVSKFLNGEISKDELLNSLVNESIKYAKRQLTWWKRNKDVVWIDVEKEIWQKETLEDIKNWVLHE